MTGDRAPMLLTSGLPLVGRDADVEGVSAMLAAARTGAARVVLVEGEPGIGKTELLRAVVADLGRDFRVLTGRGHELERDRPFGMIADALILSPGVDDPDRGAVARLLAGEDGHTERHDDFAVLRFRVVEAIIELVDRWATVQPVLLALEDVHWADPSTLLTISQLARRLADRPVAIAASFRPSRQASVLAPLRRELSSEVVAHLTLGPLADDAVLELAAASLGARPGPLLAGVLAGAAGNAFFVTELLAALVEDGTVEVSDGVAELPSAEPPAPLRLTILHRLGFLHPEGLEVLRVASVLGSRFSLADLAVVLDRPASELVTVLEEAHRPGFLVESGDALAFRHDLVRDAIYEDLPRSARQALHLQAARLLASAGRDAVQVAPHFVAGAQPGDREAIAWLERAANDALSRAPGVAAELLDAAVHLAADQPDTRDRLLVELATALTWSGQLDRAESLLADLVARSHDAEVDARIRLALARVLMIQGKALAAVQYCDDLAGTARLVGWQQARALTDAATARLLGGDVGGARRDAEHALELGRQLDDDPAVCGALAALSWVANLQGRTSQAVEIGRRAVLLAEQSTVRETGRRYPHCYVGTVLMDADRLGDGLAMFDTGRRLAEAFGDTWQLPIHHWGAVLESFYAGRYDDTTTALETANAVVEEVGTRMLVVWARAVAAHVAIRRDQLAEAAELLATADAEVERAGPGIGFDWLLWARSLLQEAEGEVEAAASTLRDAWDLAAALGIISQRRLMGPDLVRLTTETGNEGIAREVAAAMTEVAETSGVPGTVAAALRCRGVIDRDPQALLDAVGIHREGPRRIEYADACEDAGRVLAEVDRADEAREVLQEAVEVYDQAGATRSERRVDARLRALGVARGRRQARTRATVGWESLTPTELEVTRLAAEGLTNPEIGRRMFISPRTVETHLSHVYGKLNVSSRVALAAEVARRGE